MFLSVFDIFKIGIGPSSSHTMGPMTAAGRFLKTIQQNHEQNFKTTSICRFKVSLHGSLAFTGKGHATDRAIILGLAGFEPSTLDPDIAETVEKQIKQENKLTPPGLHEINFAPEDDLVFNYDHALPHHSNGMTISTFDKAGELLFKETYYSVGGGFVMTEAELIVSKKAPPHDLKAAKQEARFTYPFGTAQEMLAMGEASNLTIAEMKRANEESILGEEALDQKLKSIWQAMDNCIERGVKQGGELPGGLHVKRRAKNIYEKLIEQKGANSEQPHVVNDWLSVYAMAVNEENAAGGRVVTSPTNGAAGVVPAVIRYYKDHCKGVTDQGISDFLLTASAIGGLIKYNASISGAECGCQAEVGSAAAMAAAGLCAALGGTNMQIENAAEIALEHHLGMTCDPVNGLVQVPCIERNGLGAIKAVSAASLALHGDGSHFMPLDNCIETMRQTGEDMREKYKETSRGGLAVNKPEC